jgi:putative oxygen-independent coproporphyrinogen III oxidase
MTYSLYLHIPFCTHRCAYCDFNTYAGQESAIPAYVRALCNEIEIVGRTGGKGATVPRVHTVFFGGGTPSLLTADQFQSILRAIRANFDLQPKAEITIEANPGTVGREALGRLRALGINRISFGVQSANTEELRMLERQHSFFDVIHAVGWAREAGFGNLNLDLIYGLPEQLMATWRTSVKRAVDLGPEHLSLYALTLEHGTPFGHWAGRGLLPLPDPDLAAEMYEWAAAYLAGRGYQQYEISNWAMDDGRLTSDHAESSVVGRPPLRACGHNLQYWRSLPYLGLGAGAHGYVDSIRYSNVLRIKTYIDRLSGGPASPNCDPWPLTQAAVNRHRNSPREDMSEFMITGLRLTSEGVSAGQFASRFGVQLEEVYESEIERLVGLGLLESLEIAPFSHRAARVADLRLRLTPRARLLANQVFLEFV